MPDRPSNRPLRLLFLAAVLLMAQRPADSAVSEQANSTVPVFTRNVAPIVFKNCLRCHRAGASAGDVPLDTYAAVSQRLKEVRDRVSRREMPPWPADPNRSLPFTNDSRLAQRDIDTIVAWIDAGAPRGAAEDLPAEPVFPGGWLNPDGRAPDAVVSLPRFTLRANGEVPYIERLIEVPFTQDKWISAIQVRAGNPQLLHHMGITEVALPQGVTPAELERLDSVASSIGAPSERLQLERPAVEDPNNPGTYDMLGVYTPGTTFETYGAGNGKLLKGGRNLYLNFNIHYTTTGQEESDRSQLALWFAPKPPERMLIRAPAAVDSIIVNGRQLLTDDPGTKAEGTPFALPPIPANTARYEVIGQTAYAQPVTLYQLQPHAHARASDFDYRVVYPDGHELSVLSVPRYQYHFQLAYALVTPLTLPAGSKLIVTAHYDNSTHNEQLRHLGKSEAARRCGPGNVAYFGQQNQSWDEMFSPLIQYSDTRSSPRLRIVSAVGCLVGGEGGGWSLQRSSRATTTQGQGTSAAEVATSARVPLGSDRYRLLGTGMFQPSLRAGAKVVVKGVLIPEAGGGRINVTSMQSTSTTCR